MIHSYWFWLIKLQVYKDNKLVCNNNLSQISLVFMIGPKLRTMILFCNADVDFRNSWHRHCIYTVE